MSNELLNKRLNSLGGGFQVPLKESGPIRLAAMSRGKISQVILSSVAGFGLNSVKESTITNNHLAEIIAIHPDRYLGFATLSMKPHDIPETTKEFRRAVEKLGFKGALIDSNYKNKNFDGPEYDPLWHAAVDLDVPIYLHPSWSVGSLYDYYNGTYDEHTHTTISSIVLGWHQDVGLHCVKLFAAGIFDRHPNLKIIVGHFGEMLSFWFGRISKTQFVYRANGTRSWDEVWRTNFWITTSGVCDLTPMRSILEITSVDRILFSVDYPFTPYEAGLKWMDDLLKSNLVSRNDWEKIGFRNAEKLFSLHS